VAITVLGAAPVKLQSDVTVQPGQRLVVGARGTVRPMQTRFVDGMLVTEGAPAVGAALQAASEGMVWVLINPS
jgi:hypothetical protein